MKLPVRNALVVRNEMGIIDQSNVLSYTTLIPGIELKGANGVLVTLELEFSKNWSL